MRLVADMLLSLLQRREEYPASSAYQYLMRPSDTALKAFTTFISTPPTDLIAKLPNNDCTKKKGSKYPSVILMRTMHDLSALNSQTRLRLYMVASAHTVLKY